jgi:hypothetical protein
MSNIETRNDYKWKKFQYKNSQRWPLFVITGNGDLGLDQCSILISNLFLISYFGF